MDRTVLGRLQKIGVPQGSVLAPLIFNIFIDNMLYGTTIYDCTTIDLVINKLEKHSFEIASWFSKNFMKLNEGKCHFMLYGDKSNDHSVNVSQALIKESTEEKNYTHFCKNIPFYGLKITCSNNECIHDVTI